MHHNNKRKMTSDRGFTLIELIATIAISTVIFSVAYFVLSSYILRFEQLSKISRLNEKAYDCIMSIKNGLPVREVTTTKFQFMGLSNANKMSLFGNTVTVGTEMGEYMNGTTAIQFKPPMNHSLYSASDSLVIALNRQGAIELTGNAFGINSYELNKVVLFPGPGDKDMFVENLVFSRVPDNDISAQNNPNIDIVRVYIRAGVELGNRRYFSPYTKRRDPNYYVEYETFIAIEQGL
ncbi:prepilin-type N-terminal cleavage/methylation domain-containing protein [bacterium]|nr:prepilin-type N-terminal cleavage/methylation domain-containing protein [bacterium]